MEFSPIIVQTCVHIHVYVCVTPSLHQVELESIKLEYANVQLECNAADERAKLIASEVIGLEDKVMIF